MKTLQAFWHWVENEKPPASGTANVRDKTCTEVEVEVVGVAMDAVKARAGFSGWNQETFYAHLEAVRDLSIELCRALEAMHESVPEAPPRTWAEIIEAMPGRILGRSEADPDEALHTLASSCPPSPSRA